MNTWRNATTADLLRKARLAENTLAIQQELERRGFVHRGYGRYVKAA